MKNHILIKFLLGIVLILALVLRVYRIDSIPPSISWDEAVVGYNSWTIANYGSDEYGRFLPAFFRSFGEDKHPVLIYLTAIPVKLFGLNEFSTRIPAAVFGVLNVYLIFLLGRILFKSNIVALSAAFFLAISPYNIHFSRFSHEANLALFFFLFGIVLFYKSNSKNYFLALSTASFAISFITYLPAKVIVPIIYLILIALYFKKIIKDKAGILLSFIVIVFFSILIILNQELLGITRASQTFLAKKDVEKTRLFELTDNELLGRINLTAIQYSWHFYPQFLFDVGDKNPRHSSQTGEFYKLDALFLILGVLYLLFKRSRESVVVLFWALLAPLPSALVAEAPHAARASFMMGSWHLISALGFYTLMNLFKNHLIKWIASAIFLIVLAMYLSSYLSYYYGGYPKKYAIDWQYGMKQIVEYVKDHPEYSEVFMTDARSQPYIFFLFYLKTSLPEYLNTVLYNNSESKGNNNVSNFERYYFGGWDPLESFPNKGVLYIVTPSEYSGLRHKALFDVKKIVYYPNGSVAFYLVSGTQWKK